MASWSACWMLHAWFSMSCLDCKRWLHWCQTQLLTLKHRVRLFKPHIQHSTIIFFVGMLPFPNRNPFKWKLEDGKCNPKGLLIQGWPTCQKALVPAIGAPVIHYGREKYVNSHQDHRTNKILWKSRITIKNEHYKWSVDSIHTSYCWLLSQHFLQILSQLHLRFLQPIIQTSPWPRKNPCCWRILTVRLGQSLPRAMLPVGSRLLPGNADIQLWFSWNIFEKKHVSKKPEDMNGI